MFNEVNLVVFLKFITLRTAAAVFFASARKGRVADKLETHTNDPKRIRLWIQERQGQGGHFIRICSIYRLL
jgi:hypothetical protein